MAHFDLSLYETVAQRLVRWWEQYPNGRIITSIHHYDGSTIIMRAECYNPEKVMWLHPNLKACAKVKPINPTKRKTRHE